MKYLEVKSTDPYLNLALENYMFEYMPSEEDYFLLWQVDNSILIGKHQNTVEEINKEFVDQHDIKVVRRLTGGGAVFHDLGNVNFSFIVKRRKNRDFDFHFFVEPVLRVMNTLGIKAEFSGRNDLLIDGMKFSGNAQCAKADRLLHHGCIMVNANVDYLSEALRVKEKKYESRGIKSVRSRVTYVNERLGNPVSVETFKQLLLCEVLRENGDMRPVELHDGDRERIKDIRDSRFAAWEWNYGKSPVYNVRKEKKFPAGLVTIYMQVNKGYIEKAKLYGDFFGNEDITKLEEKFTGIRLNKNSLSEALEAMRIDTYMRDISAQDMYELIWYA